MENNEALDNTTGIGMALEAGDDESLRLILGGRTKVRHAGILRSGIMVPKKSATKEELEIYHRMVAEGRSFDDINRAMGGEPKSAKTKLFPQNVDYFSCRDDDFRRPADAAYIREHYADADGKIRSVPIWLPSSDLEAVCDHSFRAFNGKGQVRCKSFYDNGRLKFKYLKKDVAVPKPEDWLVLDTDDEDAATKACGYKVEFGGVFAFHIPGLRGAGEILCPTKSWHGLGDAVALLKRVRSVLGRFDGLFQGQPFLSLCKVIEKVRKPDGTQVNQPIVTIELTVDLMDLARYADPVQQAARAATALKALTGTSFMTASVVNQPPPENAVAYREPVAELAPAPPVEETAAAPADSGRAKVVEYYSALAASVGRTLADISAYVVVSSGQELEDMSIDELRSLAKSLKQAIAERKDDLLLAIDEAVKKLG